MLQVTEIDAGYGAVSVLRGVSLTAQSGEILCVLGRNGAGKTTLMKAIMGLVPLSAGSVQLDGIDIGSLPPHEVPRHGIGYVPQGRRLFSELTVLENLEVALRIGRDPALKARVLDLFPRLTERLHQAAGTLSGGEQQMLALARAMCVDPKVMLLDEPTEGLQPSMIAAIQDTVLRLKSDGAAVILVEQHIEAVLEIADRVLFIENGRARETVETGLLRQNDELLRRYVGV